MNKLIDAFKELLSKEKPLFILACLRVGVAFLFFINIFIPFFIVDFTTSTNPVGSYQFPGTLIFILLMFALIIAYIYFLLVKNNKLSRVCLLIEAIVISVYFLWGIILFSTTASQASQQIATTVVAGFGFYMQIILIGLSWFLVFGEKILLFMIGKYFVGEQLEPQVTELIK
ncbi:MAG: hypothetical protein WC479_09800 [Candidatus Izemoplasmatales bacterium]|jgi:hypothetical protein